MSMLIRCPICGAPKEVPAFAGDGVYSTHYCEPEIKEPAHSSELEKENGK